MKRSLVAGLIFSLFFASIVTLGHVYLFDVRVNSRMVLQPWLLRNGFVQYQHIADEHAPLLPQLLAWLLPVFHDDALLTARVVHAFLIASVVLISELWVHRTGGLRATIATGTFFLAWSGLGYWAMWYDLALAPVYLILFLVLSQEGQANVNKRLGLAGLMTGIAVLLKQQALSLALTIPLWLVWQYRSNRITGRQVAPLTFIYLLGLTIPVAAYVGYYYRRAGTLQDLLYWSIYFNFTDAYRSLGQLAPTAGQVRQILPAFLMIVPFVASIIAVQDKEMTLSRARRAWLIVFLVIAGLMLYPRYSTMHWAVALSFIALIAGIACADLIDQRNRGYSAWAGTWGIYLAVVLLWTTSAIFTYLPRLTQAQPQILIEFGNLVELSSQLKSRNLPDEGLVLLPDDEGMSNLYYLLQRQPPKYWIMNYPWLMNRYTVARWLQAMEEEQPQTLIYAQGRGEYEKYAPEIAEYVQSRYRIADTIEWNGNAVLIMTRYK